MAATLLTVITAQANDHKHEDHKDGVNKPVKKIDRRYRYAQPIVFVEGGTKFFINPNGEVDFRTLRTRSRNQNWRNGHYNTPGHNRGHGYSYGPSIRYDYYGRLKRVGMTTLSYNRYDQVRRVGSVLIRYNRRGLVSQIGGLNIYYNRYGKIRDIVGTVHYTGCGFCGVDSCSMPHDPFYNLNGNHNNYDNFYKNRKRKKKYDDDDDD